MHDFYHRIEWKLLSGWIFLPVAHELLTQTVSPSENWRRNIFFQNILSETCSSPQRLMFQFLCITIKHVHSGGFSWRKKPKKPPWFKINRRCCLSIVAVVRNDVFPSAAWALNADSPPVLHLHFQNYNHKGKKKKLQSFPPCNHNTLITLRLTRPPPCVPVVQQPLRALIMPISLHIYISLFKPKDPHKRRWNIHFSSRSRT